MRNLAKVATLAVLAGVLCGFNDANFIYDLNVYRGEPLGAAIARLGPPVQRGYIDGRRVYYWRTAFPGRGLLCKVWGTAQRNIMTNWGYQDCAF